MRSNLRRRRAQTRETGGFWLSFSDMMSVLVLVFIFVIFSMMLSLAQQKERLEKTEVQYADAMARMEASERALSEKETLLIAQEAQLKVLTDELDGKTLLLTQQQQALTDQAALISEQQSEIDQKVIVLNLEKAQLDEQVADYADRVAKLGSAKEDLEKSRLMIIDLTASLEDAQNTISVLKGDLESQKNQIVLLGDQNAALTASAESAQGALTDAEAENQRLNQRLSMLKSNADAQQSQIDALLSQIEAKKAELDQLGVDYAALIAANESAQGVMKTQSEQLSQYETELAAYKAELNKKQGELEQMVGVRAQIIETLSSALSRNRIAVTVDAQTGAITLPSEMLFAVGENSLSVGGMAYLDTFLPVYTTVLLSDEFRPYVAEIIIEGHTDSTGRSGADAYLYNLQLSQERALSVSNYVLQESYMAVSLGLNAENMGALRSLITASGRSFSSPVLNGDGTENKAASRRVEIKFRLKDDETIAATEALLELMGSN